MRWPAMSVLLITFALTGCQRASDNSPRVGNAPVNAPISANQPADNTPQPVNAFVPPADAEFIEFDGGLKVYPALKRVEARAMVLGNQSRPLEFLIVQGGGNQHESLFVVAWRAEHLKRGLEIIGLNEGKEKRSGRGYTQDPTGDRVRISVRFTRKDNKRLTLARVEDWLHDAALGTHPEPVGFTFTGSLEEYDVELNRSSVAADEVGNIVALWRDASCLLDNPRRNGVASDVYQPNPDVPGFPGANTEVTLVFEAES